MEQLADERTAEKERLSATVDEFTQEMKARLFQKVDEGYGGWDQADWDVLDRIENEFVKLEMANSNAEAQRRSIDLANFCLMAWYRKRD